MGTCVSMDDIDEKKYADRIAFAIQQEYLAWQVERISNCAVCQLLEASCQDCQDVLRTKQAKHTKIAQQFLMNNYRPCAYAKA